MEFNPKCKVVIYSVLIIADNHACIANWFKGTYSNITFNFSILSPAEFLKQASFETPIDLIFWDEAISNLVSFAQINQRFPQKDIFVVSDSESQENIIEKFKIGCKGYIHKNSTPAAFAFAFNFFQDKGLLMSPAVWAIAKPYLQKGKLLKRSRNFKKPSTSFYSHFLFDLNTLYI